MSAAPLAARIAELARMLDGTDITALTLCENGETLILRRDPEPGTGTAAAAAGGDPAPGIAVTAPCPGIVRLRHPLRTGPLAMPGRAVAAGDVLGLLQLGPLLVPVTAPRPGTLLAAVAAEGTLVGYGTPLFQVAPDAEDP